LFAKVVLANEQKEYNTELISTLAHASWMKLDTFVSPVMNV